MANPKQSKQTVEEGTLLALEDRYWRAIRDADIESAVALTADPCVVAGASGVSTIGRDAFRHMMQSAKWKLVDYQMKDAKVQLLGDDLAVVAYRIHEQLTVDGKPLALDAADASTWVRRDGSWQCVLHTESIAGDPFGRDRAAQ